VEVSASKAQLNVAKRLNALKDKDWFKGKRRSLKGYKTQLRKAKEKFRRSHER